eukprot:m.15387 g.15387  ORF g.15387 m.15387 type:complete len:89 (+) comp10453_c0_seq1:139-405(+)
MSAAMALIRKNVALAPLAVVVVAGCGLAAGYIARVNVAGHYLTWTEDNTYPWQNIKPTQNTKFLGLQGNYKHEEVFKPLPSDDLRGRL